MTLSLGVKAAILRGAYLQGVLAEGGRKQQAGAQQGPG